MEAVKQGGDTERIRAPALRIIRWKMFTTAIFALFAVYGFYVTLFHAKWATVAMCEYILFVKGQFKFGEEVKFKQVNSKAAHGSIAPARVF